MPFRPGRLMSVRTTVGFSFGRLARALSAVPCSLTNRNPSVRRIQSDRIWRAWASSSTIETEILTFLLYERIFEGGVVNSNDSYGNATFTGTTKATRVPLPGTL